MAHEHQREESRANKHLHDATTRPNNGPGHVGVEHMRDESRRRAQEHGSNCNALCSQYSSREITNSAADRGPAAKLNSFRSPASSEPPTVQTLRPAVSLTNVESGATAMVPGTMLTATSPAAMPPSFVASSVRDEGTSERTANSCSVPSSSARMTTCSSALSPVVLKPITLPQRTWRWLRSS